MRLKMPRQRRGGGSTICRSFDSSKNGEKKDEQEFQRDSKFQGSRIGATVLV